MEATVTVLEPPRASAVRAAVARKPLVDADSLAQPFQASQHAVVSRLMIRPRRPVVFLALLAMSLSCSAHYPAAPSPSVAGLQLFYGQATNRASYYSSFPFRAYAVWSDGAYEEVTVVATWTSSNQQVLRPSTTTGYFTVAGYGVAEVLARYQDATATLPLAIPRVDATVYPRLVVSGGDPLRVGVTAPLYLTLQRSYSASDTVTTYATWKSTDPSIAAVKDGSVTGLRPGTATVSASFNDLSVEYTLSILPGK